MEGNTYHLQLEHIGTCLSHCRFRLLHVMQARVAGPVSQLVLCDMSVMVKREWTMQLAFDAYSVATVEITEAHSWFC